jgi:hydrogenase-4 component E
MLVLKATEAAPSEARVGLAIALAIILLGMLMMITRRNAVMQIIGFMSIENGLILGATGARGMPLVVEISVAFSVLIALFVFAVFVFRIRERFDTVDVIALEKVRGDRQ